MTLRLKAQRPQSSGRMGVAAYQQHQNVNQLQCGSLDALRQERMPGRSPRMAAEATNGIHDRRPYLAAMVKAALPGTRLRPSHAPRPYGAFLAPLLWLCRHDDLGVLRAPHLESSTGLELPGGPPEAQQRIGSTLLPRTERMCWPSRRRCTHDKGLRFECSGQRSSGESNANVQQALTLGARA